MDLLPQHRFFDFKKLRTVKPRNVASVVGNQLHDVARIIVDVDAVHAVARVAKPRQNVGRIVEHRVEPKRVARAV